MIKMKIDVKFLVLGVLIFALAMGFTFANCEHARAAGQENPLVGFRFSLDIQGVVQGYFTEASNIGSETEVTEQKITDKMGRPAVIKIPGRLKFLDITLKRGITSNMELQRWRKLVEAGNVDSARRDGSIFMYDQKLTPIAQWNFTRGWPSKFVSNPVDASGMNPSGVLGIESVTLTVESIQRVK